MPPAFCWSQTAWFKNLVRERIESVVERATGGRVEIGSFSYNWRDLTADVKPFVLHGTEPASAPPLFRADKIQIGLKIISALEKKVDIASLVVESPRAVHHHWSGRLDEYSAGRRFHASTRTSSKIFSISRCSISNFATAW